MIDEFERAGYKHAHIDGGALIASFIHEKRISKMIITQTPIFLAARKTLFGLITQQIKCKIPRVTFANECVLMT